jgi:arsenate reductase
MSKLNILFLCTGNSCRSQMAEGWCHHFHNQRYNSYSAGIETHGLNPWALKVMEEQGLDISHHQSQTLEDLGDIKFDYVFTVCGHAHEHCPIFQGQAKIIHMGFDDPPKLAAGLTEESEILPIYRRVRDHIKESISNLEKTIHENC